MTNRPPAIHQFSPGLSYGDAISNYAINLKLLLHAWGYQSEIYVINSDPRVAKYCKSYHAYEYRSGDILIYHYGAASEITAFLLNWLDRLVIVYHGITPPHFFAEDVTMAGLQNQAKEDLQKLSTAPCAIGDSDYNCRDLRALGFKDVQTLPVLLNLSNLNKFSDTEAHQRILHRLNDGYVNILFVGRLAPNKRQDDLIRFLAYYKALINPQARLLLIGSAPLPWYKAMLEIQAEQLGIADDVHFLGHVTLKDGFSAYYRGSTVFLSMSEHEGFGIPLLESMYFDLPVIAYAVTAVPETMGEAGILINEKRYDVIGELVHLVATDQSLREKILRKQQEQLNCFDRVRLERQFQAWILELQETFKI